MKKNILILATGGTIAGKHLDNEETSKQYSSAQIHIDDLLAQIPQIKKLADISCEQILTIGSQDLGDKELLLIANKVNDALKKDDIDGIVITHGTDTIEETAYFLNLIIRSQKPVILTGAMRPNDADDFDGDDNLYNAILLASNEKAKNQGILVLMAGKIFAARDVSKIHTNNIDAFGAPNSSNIGEISANKLSIQNQQNHNIKNAFTIDGINNLPKADIIYMHSGFDANIIDFLIKSGSKAIIVATMGNGNISKNALEKLIYAAKQNIAIIKSSRVGSGKVGLNIEIDDDKYGFISAGDLNPQKARILAKLALIENDDFDFIKEVFLKY